MEKLEKITCRGFVEDPRVKKEEEQHYKQYNYCCACKNSSTCGVQPRNSKAYATTDGSCFSSLIEADVHCIERRTEGNENENNK